jgi:phage tail sheath protein FI
MSFFGNHNSKTGKVKFAEKQENLQQQKQQLNLIVQSLHDKSTATSNPKNTRATKAKKTKNSRRRKEVDQNYIPSNATLAASADGTGHLHELFLVHGGQRWRVACARKERSA